MSQISQSIRKFNRFEIKYILTLKQAEDLKKDLALYLVPDQHSTNDGRYKLASVYYDSPKLNCYWEKVNGDRFRRKLRIRHYESSTPLQGSTPVFAEIKQRIGKVTQKRRAVLTYDQALQLCNHRVIPEYAREDKAVIEEIYEFIWRYNLQPVNIIRYDRQAFMSRDWDQGLRVTFDTKIRSQEHPLSLQTDMSDLPIVSENQVILEIKVNEQIPMWLTQIIAAHNLHTTGFSKYCRGIESRKFIPTYYSQVGIYH